MVFLANIKLKIVTHNNFLKLSRNLSDIQNQKSKILLKLAPVQSLSGIIYGNGVFSKITKQTTLYKEQNF